MLLFMNHCNDFAPCGPSIGQYISYSYSILIKHPIYCTLLIIIYNGTLVKTKQFNCSNKIAYCK